MGYTPGFEYARIFDYHASKLVESGSWQRMKTAAFSDDRGRLEDCARDERGKTVTIRLADLVQYFNLLVAGIVAAFVIGVGEGLVHVYKSAKRGEVIMKENNFRLDSRKDIL